MHDDETTNCCAEHGAERAARMLLKLVADWPGQMGRLRASRIVGGYPVPQRDDTEGVALAAYSVELDWPLREITRLVDALITGRLMIQTPGPRPTLVLTRSGHRTLDAMEQGVTSHTPTTEDTITNGSGTDHAAAGSAGAGRDDRRPEPRTAAG